MMRKEKIFICYSSDSTEYATQVESELESEGTYEVLIDRTSLRVGDSVSARIIEWIEICDRAVIIIDPTFSSKSYAQNELDRIRKRWRGRPNRVLPIIVPPATKEHLPAEFRGVKAMEWKSGSDLQLLAQLKEIRSEEARRFLTLAASIVLGLGLTTLVAIIASSSAGPDPAGPDPAGPDPVSMQSALEVSSTSDDSDLEEVPEPPPTSCYRDLDCGANGRCLKVSSSRRRSLGSVVKKIDYPSTSKTVGRSCPEGSKRLGQPRGKVTNGGTCDVHWRTTNENDCEVDVDVFGPTFKRIECSIGVALRGIKSTRGKCTMAAAR